MNEFLEACIMPLVILLTLCFATLLVCGVIKLASEVVAYIVRENVPILDSIAIGSLTLGILIAVLIIILAVLHNETK